MALRVDICSSNLYRTLEFCIDDHISFLADEPIVSQTEGWHSNNCMLKKKKKLKSYTTFYLLLVDIFYRFTG